MPNKYRIIVELTSVVAIILSLVFLGLEVKQSNQLAKAEIRQALNVTDMEVYKVQMEEDIIAKALYKINKNIPIDDYEEYQLDEFQRFNFRDFDNSFYQYRIGLFDENVWFAYRRIIKSLLMQNYIMIMWGNSNQSFSIEFQDEVNNIIKEIKDDVAFGLKENATKVN
tara:strand:- start:14 stop:517 length:504 start_codon:yes stop_codon:yes gene_type:complete